MKVGTHFSRRAWIFGSVKGSSFSSFFTLHYSFSTSLTPYFAFVINEVRTLKRIGDAKGADLMAFSLG
jgi:hypothetical protein